MSEINSEALSISVIVTSYQSAESIARALRSVLAQTVAPHEILVCDDGSTDETVSIAGTFAGVRVISLPHSGIVGISRNRGIAAASGTWVAFLDADDEWTTRHLEHFLEIHRSSHEPFALFGGNAERLTVDGRAPFFRAGLRPEAGSVSVEDLLRVRPVITSTAIVNRSKALEAGGFAEDEDSVSAEDFSLWYRLHPHGLYFDPRAHGTYTESMSGLTLRERGYSSRNAAIHVLRELIDIEDDPNKRSLLKEALVRDEMTLSSVAARDRRWAPMLASARRGMAVGVSPVASVARRFLARRSSRVLRAALILTVAASIVVSLLGLFRQKAVASIIGPAGLADLSLLLSIATPLAAFALWPLISFAKDLNDRGNELYERSLRSAALTCFFLYVLGAIGLLVVAALTRSLRFPLGNSSGVAAALLFALGMVGIGFTTSVLTFRGDLGRWRRVALGVAASQAAVVATLAIVFGREGAVWGMAGITGAAGVVLLARGLLRNHPQGFRLPERWIVFAGANATVMVSLAAAEAGLRQVSADSSAVTAAFFQASLSIIGAISAGVAQYTGGRLLPVATGARDSGSTRLVWKEVRNAALIVGAFVAVVGGVIVLLAPQILRIAFASEFAAASPLLRLVVLGECCVALSTVVTTALLGLGKTALWTALSVIPALARIGSYIALNDLSATTRLGWAYGVGGILSLLICAAAFAWMSGREPRG